MNDLPGDHVVAFLMAGTAVVITVVISVMLALFTGSDPIFYKWWVSRHELGLAKQEVKKAEALHKDRCPRINDNPKEKKP